jgi:hypothetical protein
MTIQNETRLRALRKANANTIRSTRRRIGVTKRLLTHAGELQAVNREDNEGEQL